MLALPFIDMRRERRLSRRPVAVVITILTVIAMGVLTYKGATAREALGTELEEAVPEWAERQGFAGNEQAVAGARLFAVTGCAQCHVYLGIGSVNLGAPELSDIGAGDRGADYFKQYVANPSQFGNPVMPRYGEEFGGSLNDEQLTQIATFLDASKGPEE
jgi:mono/diheme cytochrome c family protein